MQGRALSEWLPCQCPPLWAVLGGDQQCTHSLLSRALGTVEKLECEFGIREA